MQYEYTEDSKRQLDVPRGALTKHEFCSQIFGGTVRDYWLYVPAQYRAREPAPLMVFQDGQAYVTEDGAFRVPIVFEVHALVDEREVVDAGFNPD